MTTATAIHSAAKKLNIQVVERPHMLGLMLSEYVYYWWSISDDGTAIGHHIYSQRTGKSSKNWKRFFSAEDRIKKLA